MDERKFDSGTIYWTPAVNDLVGENNEFAIFVLDSFNRHVHADWGDLSDDDMEANNEALKTGDERLFSAYQHPAFTKIWIITEADRSLTTILFPDEY